MVLLHLAEPGNTISIISLYQLYVLANASACPLRTQLAQRASCIEFYPTRQSLMGETPKTALAPLNPLSALRGGENQVPSPRFVEG